jgi:hypothetical protein
MVKTPYAEIDAPVRGLVRVLNRFPGISTYTSCGGHEEVSHDDQAPASCWYVDFLLARTDEGWISLEFFGWIAYEVAPDGVALEVLSKPPFVNLPGKMVFFRWSGGPAASADAFADTLSAARRQYYVTAAAARKWVEP